MMAKNIFTTVATAALAAVTLAPVAVRADEETPQARRERAINRIEEYQFHSHDYPWLRNPRGQYIRIDSAQNDADLLLLGELQDLTTLEILPNDNNTFTNAGFAFLAKTKELDWLMITFYRAHKVDEGILKYIEDLPKLREVVLDGDKFTERGLASLGKIKSLQTIYIEEWLESADLRHLQGLPNLFELHFYGSSKDYYDLAPVSKLTELEVLSLGGAKIRGEDLVRLKALKHLHSLSLYRATIEGGLEALQELPRLRELDLSASNVTDQDMAALAKSRTLTKLTLNGCDITDKGLAELFKRHWNDHWKELQISGTKVTDEGLLSLDDYYFMEKLNVDYKAISDEAIARIKEKAPRKIIIEKQ